MITDKQKNFFFRNINATNIPDFDIKDLQLFTTVKDINFLVLYWKLVVLQHSLIPLLTIGRHRKFVYLHKDFSPNAKTIKHENEPGNVQYFIVKDKKPETPHEGPETFSPAEMVEPT